MLQALATLLVFQTVGEVLSYALALPVPGPVLEWRFCWRFSST
jgi:holin-like protein